MCKNLNVKLRCQKVKKWAVEFKRGRTSLEDDPREGRPKSATTPEIMEQVHAMVLDDQRIKVRVIAETIGISKERVRYSYKGKK